MLDISKETHVGWMRHAFSYLQAELIEARKQIAELKALADKDKELCETLSAALALLRKQFFAKTSERRPEKGPKSNPKRKPQSALLIHNKRLVDADLPLGTSTLTDEERLHTELVGLSQDEEGHYQCSCGKGLLLPMSGAFEESAEIDVTERSYKWLRHKRQKCKCTACQKIVCANGPDKLKEGAAYSLHMAVQVVDDKYHRHIPLNRQADIMRENGLKVEPKTLYGLSQHLMAKLADLPDAIKEEIVARDHVGIDESRVDLFYPKTTGYVWSMTNQAGAYYQYETTRSGKIADEMLKGYQGRVMADAFAGYDHLEKNPLIQLGLCLAHVRRKFDEAKVKYPKADEAVAIIDKIYEAERKARTLPELAKIRARSSRQYMEELQKWMTDQKGLYFESSPIGKAIAHATEYWPRLCQFLTDEKMPLDNNGAERTQRRPVMGRNNFNGYRTIDGADTAMFFYTLIESCKIIGVMPKAYLLEMSLRATKGEALETPLAYGKALEEKVGLELQKEMALKMAQGPLN